MSTPKDSHEIGNGDRIRQARDARGITRAQLAEALGVGETQAGRLEMGARFPTVEQADILEELLELRVIVGSGKAGRIPEPRVIQVWGDAPQARLLELLGAPAWPERLDTRWAPLIAALGFEPDPEAELFGLTEEEECYVWDGRRVVVEQYGDALRVAFEGDSFDFLMELGIAQ